MRRFIPLFAVLVASLGASSCNNTVLVKFGDLVMETTCREQLTMGGGGCTSLVHDVNDSDGSGGVHITCSATTTTLNFNVRGTDPTGQAFTLALSGVSYGATGAATGGSLNLTEGGTTYSGRVSSAPPTATLECQVTGIMQTTDPDMNAQIEGNILCDHLKASGDPTQIRELQAMSVTPDQPFHFRIVFCDGLAMH